MKINLKCLLFVGLILMQTCIVYGAKKTIKVNVIQDLYTWDQSLLELEVDEEITFEELFNLLKSKIENEDLSIALLPKKNYLNGEKKDIKLKDHEYGKDLLSNKNILSVYDFPQDQISDEPEDIF